MSIAVMLLYHVLPNQIKLLPVLNVHQTRILLLCG